MKREELIELQVPEESIKKIMDINGADIERVRQEVKVKEQQLQDIQINLEQANSQIEEFKSMNMDEIKKACEEWKEKAEKAQTEKLQFIHESKVASYVKSLNLRDDIYERYVTKMLLDKGLQFDGDTLIGAEDVVQPFRQSYPDAFKGEEQPKFVDETGNSQNPQLTKEDFKKMGYQERLILKSESPEIYEALKE